ncbi:BolA family transcriptional regulator [Sulfitobacter albidus]|uniref:BolA family transcriptional regulator n=1 Tax=Sulfitobacter albidus TaxID=2829501 RepID=A0A975JAY7_9RHOB|nr:BolA family protein [Sulfitobacter albidus]QUJ75098.1 BolA family transcriptional regulator [Sulfitobacter albidus]
MSVTAQIEAALRAAFTVESLQVNDVSEAHRGHAGFQEGGESHFDVALTAPELAGKTRIAKHRAVHAALGPELIGRIHALSLDLKP